MRTHTAANAYTHGCTRVLRASRAAPAGKFEPTLRARQAAISSLKSTLKPAKTQRCLAGTFCVVRCKPYTRGRLIRSRRTQPFSYWKSTCVRSRAWAASSQKIVHVPANSNLHRLRSTEQPPESGEVQYKENLCIAAMEHAFKFIDVETLPNSMLATQHVRKRNPANLHRRSFACFGKQD
eukprot:2880416-Pleurochrysis_carterae.AAC.2